MEGFNIKVHRSTTHTYLSTYLEAQISYGVIVNDDGSIEDRSETKGGGFIISTRNLYNALEKMSIKERLDYIKSLNGIGKFSL